jgi:transcriptional regulator with PAS, ATPase and Fis domain
LFGHEAGSFTGASKQKQGQLEVASGGTVFLDEIGEMPPSQQVKLLRVLEERRVMPVGGVQSRPIDVRLLSATNRDLPSAVAEGTFREDLYYRLNGITLRIPPLRERPGQIEILARQFVSAAAARTTAAVPALSPAAVTALRRHPWPGNIRELKNVIERAVVLGGEGPIEPAHLGLSEVDAAPAGPTPEGDALPDDERARIVAALTACAGNQTRAAKALGISRKTLGHKMDRYQIPRPQKG